MVDLQPLVPLVLGFLVVMVMVLAVLAFNVGGAMRTGRAQPPKSNEEQLLNDIMVRVMATLHGACHTGRRVIVSTHGGIRLAGYVAQVDDHSVSLHDGGYENRHLILLRHIAGVSETNHRRLPKR